MSDVSELRQINMSTCSNPYRIFRLYIIWTCICIDICIIEYDANICQHIMHAIHKYIMIYKKQETKSIIFNN